MATSENRQQPPNPAPPSVSAGDHEMRDYYAAQDASRPLSQQEPYLTPYLGLRARLSQTWINRWTILLLLVLIRTLLALASLDDNLGTAKKQALSACTSVENVGSAMASMPYYMSQGVNELAVSGIEKAINGLMEMLILSITAVEEIVLFIINLMTSTYVCLITLAVSGSLHVAVSVAEDVGNFLNATAKDIGKDLGGAATDFQNAMNSFLADINKVTDVLTGDNTKAPTINLSGEINALDTLQLPSGYDADLQKLNASIPTFAQVHNFTDNMIKLPFEEIKKLLNESLPKYTMNSSLFPVPAKEQLTFCSDNNGINDFFEHLVHIELLAKRIFLIVVIIAAILVMAPMAWRETRRYRFMQERARLIRRDDVDSMDAVYLASRPYTSTFGMWLGDKFKSTRRRIAVRWSVAYATTGPALFVLSLALAGLLACLCQFILLKAIDKEVPSLTNEVGAFADEVIMKLNNASEQWAIGTNHIINDTNVKINKDVFGWVNTSTTAVNDTLVAFVDGMTDVLNTTFGGTILYDPIMGVLNCLVLLKIQGIENGLTWVHDHAHIDFPLLSNNTFSIGTVAKVAGTQQDILANAPGETAADEISSAVLHVTHALEKAVRQEAIISTCILLIWVIIVLVGCCQAGWWFIKGGDHGVYSGPPRSLPSDSCGPARTDKHELDQFFRAPAPTYEQATAATGAKEASNDNNSANRYNGQSYTLTRKPMPTFDANGSPLLRTGFSPPNEKLSTVAGINSVDNAIRRPDCVRNSSYGDYGMTSPTSPPLPSFLRHHPPSNIFFNSNHVNNFSNDPTSNPFADPTR